MSWTAIAVRRRRARRATTFVLAVLGLATAAGPAVADLAGRLGWPVACEAGRDCWITVHQDLEPGPGARDFACTAMTSDGHDGTDIAIRDLPAMQEGVVVLAAAGGTVRAIRDGMADVSVRETGLSAVGDRACGNGVAIDHGDGWETQYCHLRQGSVAVRSGDRVGAGQRLGLVGMSGLSEYPHLHFSVRHHDRHIDPFRGRGADPACGATASALWQAPIMARLPSPRGAVFNAGFASDTPTQDAAQTSLARRPELGRDRPLIVWGHVFNVDVGDVITLRLATADGTTIAEDSHRVERRQVRLLRFTGRRPPPGGWPAGAYTGIVTIDSAALARPGRIEVAAEMP